MITWLVYLFGLRRNARAHVARECHACGTVGPTSCLPFLGGHRFCLSCAREIASP